MITNKKMYLFITFYKKKSVSRFQMAFFLPFRNLNHFNLARIFFQLNPLTNKAEKKRNKLHTVSMETRLDIFPNEFYLKIYNRFSHLSA